MARMVGQVIDNNRAVADMNIMEDSYLPVLDSREERDTFRVETLVPVE